MAPRVYATLADLSAYAPAELADLLPVEPEATRLLTSASQVIERALKSALYPTDANGMPTLQQNIETMSRATCAQAIFWLATDDELGTQGLYASVTIGNVTLGRGGRGDATTVTGQQLAPQAETELATGQMLPGSLVQIQVWEQAWP